MDHEMNLKEARNILGEKICLMGNSNPNDTFVLRESGEVEEESIQTIRKAGRKGSFILSSGCSIPAIVSPEKFVRWSRREESLN